MPSPPTPRLPGPTDHGPVFRLTSLQAEDRLDIVELSANFAATGAAYIAADRLHLSALGADVDLTAIWNAPTTSNLIAWHHVATAGRDQFVRLVRRGYLFPFGHRAVEITIVDRVLTADPVPKARWSDARLRLRQFIQVVQPTVSSPALGQPFSGRSWPFSSATITSLTTPSIELDPKANGQANRILIAGDPYLWSVTLVDEQANEHHVTIPQLFVYGFDLYGGADKNPNAAGYPDEFQPSTANTIASIYNGLDAAERTTSLSGRPLQLAPPAASHPGVTTHPTYSITLEAATATADPAAPNVAPGSVPSRDQLAASFTVPWYPSLASARVKLPAAEALSKQSFSSPGGQGLAIGLLPSYVASGANQGRIYAQVVDEASPHVGTAQRLLLPGDTVGALATPNVEISALSATAGAIGGDPLAYAQSGQFTAKDYFDKPPGSELPQLFGGIYLTDVLGDFSNATKVPALHQQVDAQSGTRTITYELDAQLVTKGAFQASDRGTLRLVSTTTITSDGSSSTVIDGTISAFSIAIAGSGSLHLLDLDFDTTRFHANAGSKPSIHPALSSVALAGSLSFVQQLAQVIQDYFGGDGFKIEVLPSEISVGLSIELPEISVGVFSMEHLGLTLALHVPFTGAPAVAVFSFATHDQPFIVTVSMFGGGGYVAIGVGLVEIQSVACDFDFGANLALDVGVASGSISATAGFGFAYDGTAGTELSGFVKLHGSLEFLGMVSLSIELDLELDWYIDEKKMAGTASLVVDIDVAFFSTSVGFSVHREFSTGGGASGARPAMASAAAPALSTISFKDLLSDAAEWQQYCAAYA